VLFASLYTHKHVLSYRRSYRTIYKTNIYTPQYIFCPCYTFRRLHRRHQGVWDTKCSNVLQLQQLYNLGHSDIGLLSDAVSRSQILYTELTVWSVWKAVAGGAEVLSPPALTATSRLTRTNFRCLYAAANPATSLHTDRFLTTHTLCYRILLHLTWYVTVDITMLQNVY
jgi:hypothetical protein